MKAGNDMYGLTPFEKDFVFDPFGAFERSIMKDSGQLSVCRTDIREEESRYIMESELPGFEKENITVDISGTSLTLKAERCNDTKDSGKDGRYIRRERSCASYRRSFDITGVDGDGITADYKTGILTMILPKKKPEVPASRRLNIG